MSKYLYRILALVLLVTSIFSFAGCTIVLDGIGGSVGGGELGGGGEDGGSEGGSESGGEVVFPGESEDELPDEWSDPSASRRDRVAVRVILDTDADLKGYLEELEISDEVIWSSRCTEIASVDDGVVRGEGVGRTLVTASVGDEAVMEFTVTVEFMISQNSGFNIVTTVVDDTEYKVSSMREANSIIDRAIASRVGKLTIDFSGISPDFTAEDFDLDSELGNHTSLKMLYYDASPYRIEFEIVYRKDAASNTTEEGSVTGSTVADVSSVNALAYHSAEFKNATPRADNFDDFAINSEDIPEWTVYNSEELWWVIEHGYRPTFPETHTKAELFYERAKMILREIIHDGMSDYDKVRAIYEYLVTAVNYDYDAYFGGVDRDNTCYFLEGVFEAGRAVCDGKTKAFVLLCGIEGVTCVRDFGASATGDAGHAWNYVRIDEYWYLVDTTEGDVRYKADSGIGGYFGSDIEALGYSAFMRPVDYLSDKYVYTDKWSDILESDKSSIPYDYFEAMIIDQINFSIDSRDEANALFSMATVDGVPETAILVFVPRRENDSYNYFRDVEREYGYDFQIFTTEYGDETVYLALFSLANETVEQR